MKTGFATIIGKPNSGKSTLLNAILKEHINITSKKPQTTRKNARGIYNDDDSQIVFIDTPGVHKSVDRLDKYMEKSIIKSLDDVDVIIVLIDIKEYKEDDISFIFDELKIDKNKSKDNIIICFNKIDLVEDAYIDNIKEDFKDKNIDCIFLSSLKKKNIDKLIDLIKGKLKEGAAYYDRESFTDMQEKEIVGELIREQCLYKLDKEIPHGIACKVRSMSFSSGKCVINADIICEKDNHKGIIIGKAGSMLKNIGFASRKAIEELLQLKVFLELRVVVKKNWKDDLSYLKDFGYDINEL